MKRILSLLFAFVLLSGLLLSCGSPSVEVDAPGSDTAAGTEPEITETTMLTDAVPELNFAGAEFNCASQGTATNNMFDLWVAEETGDAVNDAIYERKRAIEERFDIVINEPLFGNDGAITSAVKNTVAAGEDAYDLVINQMEATGRDVVAGYYYNWNDIPYVDFTMPWYPPSLIESATLEGKTYSVASDLCLTYTQQTWAMIFSKAAQSDNNLPDFYALVDNGEWTVDRLTEVTKDLYRDTNGDGTRDLGDFYGFCGGASPVAGCLNMAFLYAAGQRTVTVNDDLSLNFLLGTEKAADLAVKLNNLFYVSDGSTTIKETSRKARNTFFMEGHAAIIPMQVTDFNDYMRESDVDYGVIPLPKYDEAQDEYYTVCDAGSNVLVVPVTAGNIEMTGAVVEALSAYSYNYVLPTYIDIALETKGTRDEQSVEMVRRVLASRVMDFAYLYDGWKGWTFKADKLVLAADTYASTYASMEGAINAYYETVIDFFVK